MAAPSSPVAPLTVIAWRLTGLSLADVWLCYLEIGGSLSRQALRGYLAGEDAWPALERNVLAQAVNEQLWDRGWPSLAPYRESDASASGWPAPTDDRLLGEG